MLTQLEYAATSLVSPPLGVQATESSRSPLKLGVLASGSGSNFAAIAAACANGELPAQVQVMIYNNPNARAAERADQWHIPSRLINHRDYAEREALDRAIINTLQEFAVEWVVMAGWMRVVTPVLIDAFPGQVLNIHPSLLPSFRGVRAVEQALAAGVKITGCTVHLVVPELDSGPILTQAAVPILPSDTPETLHARIQVQEHLILKQAISLIALDA
jgi:phosphoribosylglycinamide formyltransferase 1